MRTFLVLIATIISIGLIAGASQFVVDNFVPILDQWAGAIACLGTVLVVLVIILAVLLDRTWRCSRG
jgi:hypothetical protein